MTQQSEPAIKAESQEATSGADDTPALLLAADEDRAASAMEPAPMEARPGVEQQRRLYETIIASTPDLVYAFDLDYRFTFVNEALLKMWGRTLEESIGKRFLDVGYEPWHAEMHEREIDRVVATGESVRGEVAFPHSELGRRIYDYILVPVFGRDGQVEAVAGTTRDVTERKQAEEALRESEQRFAAIFKQAAGGIACTDLEGRFTLVNDRYCEIVGRSREELLEMRMQELTHPHDLPRNLYLFRAVVKEGRSFSLDKRYIRPDGSHVWVTNEVSAITDGDGRPVAILAVCHDISQRKRGEQERRRLTTELQLERSRLHEIFLRAPAIIATLRGPDHVFEAANPLYLQIVGDRDILGKPVREALPELEGQEIFDLLDTVYRSGEPYTASELRVELDRRGTGELEEVFFNFVYQPLHDPDGTVSGIFVHAVDVTDQVRARKQIEQAREAAEDANRAKSTFLATMSHELRTPLNAIIGYTELLELGVAGPVNEPQGVQLGRIAAGAKHLLQLIEEVLTFSRIEAGHLELHLQGAELGEIVRDTAGLVAPLAAEKGLRFRFDAPEQPVRMVTDEGKVRQILINLLGNAIKFTDHGEVCMRARAAGEEVIIEVRDTGIGIPAGAVDQIFEPFKQASRGATRHAGGTGLGLSVSRQLARLLGGDITVESVPEQGSTFTVRLPRSGSG